MDGKTQAGQRMLLSRRLAEAGVQKGLIYGKSNALAAEPEEDKVGVQDLATLIYHQLGSRQPR